MRQLGKGHYVMFFAPGEVDRRIRSLIPNRMASGDRIKVLDVVRWAMHETCESISHYLPFWVQQGIDHHKRFRAYEEHRSAAHSNDLRRAWLQSELQTLEEMYWIAARTDVSLEINSVPSVSQRTEKLGLGVMKLVNIRIAEEQEREVNHEVEARHRRRPSPTTNHLPLSLPRVQPARHVIHGDIRKFIETGILQRSSMHISPLWVPLDMANALDSTTEWSPSPLATADFVKTTLDSDGLHLTEFLRPVNWILSSGTGKNSIVIVISPYEANELLPIIRKSNKVRLHIYAPRLSSTMHSFSDLTFYSIPDSPGRPWPAPMHIRIELNLFSGQLYFDSREEYENVCVLLALWMAHPGTERSDIDGFVPPAYRTRRESPFARSMVPILKTLTGLRRKGVDYNRTHLGQILNAKPLSEEAIRQMNGFARSI
jgi:hypothetical protein